MRFTFLAPFMLCALAGTALAAETESRILSERSGDWFYRCVEAGENQSVGTSEAKAESRCEVVQIAQTKQGDQVITLMTISLSEMEREKKKQTVLTVLTPLNVYLPAGLELSVDQGQPITLRYRNCNNAGCWIQHIIDNKLLGSLKSGRSGFAKIRLINGQNLNVKFSLAGVTDALKKLASGEKPKDG